MYKKEVKKLCRMLDAAGIQYQDRYKQIVLIEYNYQFAFSYLMILQRGAKYIFGIIKNATDFKGNDWDGLKNRLEESMDWVYEEDEYLHRSQQHLQASNIFAISSNQYTFTIYDYELEAFIPIKPHQLWKLLDKVDTAKIKGGKRTVKFNDCKYEFHFS